MVDGMSTTFKAMSEAQYNKGIADAQKKMDEAKAAYDVEAYDAARTEKDQLNHAKATTAATTAAEPPEVADFCERNPWFEKNAVMRTDALEYREAYLRRNPGAPITDVLTYIETKMQRDYPDSFKTSEQKRNTPAVEGASTSSHTDPLAKLKASMSVDEKRIMKMFVGDGKLSEKEYLESYSTVRER